MIQRFLIKLWIHWLGVRFFQTQIVPNNAEVLRSVFETVNGKTIEFLFYRENFLDTVYKRGTFKKKRFHSLVILAKFPEDLDAPMIKFNGQFYFFEGPWLKWIDDEILADELLRVYLYYIQEKF